MANILIKQGLEIAVPDFVITTDEARKVDLTSIIQTGTTASQAISAGTYFYLNGTLVRAKVDIANGATFTLNTNYEVVTAGALNELNDALNYSTTEHVVGKWVDGRVLYEKTIDCGALPNNSAKTVNHNISNIKEVVDIKGVFGDGSSWFMINNANPSQLIAQIQVVVNTLNVLITTAANLAQYNQTWVTIQYTKTV